MKGQEALLLLRDENKRVVAQLAEANATLGRATKIVASTHDSLKKLEDYKKTRDEKVAKFWEELLKESASRKEAGKALEEGRGIHEQNLQSRKVALELAIEEDKRLRKAAETRIEVLEGELKEAKIELEKSEVALNEAKVKIRTAIADYKKRAAFENLIESRRRKWLSDFQESPGYEVEMRQATLESAEKVLEKLEALHPEWNVYDEVKRQPN